MWVPVSALLLAVLGLLPGLMGLMGPVPMLPGLTVLWLKVPMLGPKVLVKVHGLMVQGSE
jgi:hypothetical protein